MKKEAVACLCKTAALFFQENHSMWANRTLLREKWPLFGQLGTSNQNAGLLMFRRSGGELQLLLVHPGGDYLRNQDLGTWTIPQGEVKPDEVVLHAACRRFTEEIGLPAFGPFIPLKPALERNGNVVHGWACEAADDAVVNVANVAIPDGDRAEWFSPRDAKMRIDPAQSYWIDELVAQLHSRS
jgi:predicted NUDIX family NTP pyrophosphohydrolase